MHSLRSINIKQLMYIFIPTKKKLKNKHNRLIHKQRHYNVSERRHYRYTYILEKYTINKIPVALFTTLSRLDCYVYVFFYCSHLSWATGTASMAVWSYVNATAHTSMRLRCRVMLWYHPYMPNIGYSSHICYSNKLQVVHWCTSRLYFLLWLLLFV